MLQIKRNSSIRYSVLTPNLKGYMGAVGDLLILKEIKQFIS